MKNCFSIVILAVATAGLFATGCERHPASQTVKGYAEKEAAKKAQQEEQETTALGAENNSPSYFPPKKSE